MTRYVDAFRVALWYGTTEQTARRWCRQGLFPGAIRGHGRMNLWRIPAEALEGFEPPKRGGDRRSGAYREAKALERVLGITTARARPRA